MATHLYWTLKEKILTGGYTIRHQTILKSRLGFVSQALKEGILGEVSYWPQHEKGHFKTAAPWKGIVTDSGHCGTPTSSSCPSSFEALERQAFSPSGQHFDPKVFAQLLQEDKSEHGVRDQANASRNKALEKEMWRVSF